MGIYNPNAGKTPIGGVVDIASDGRDSLYTNTGTYLLANGQDASTTEYPELFALNTSYIKEIGFSGTEPGKLAMMSKNGDKVSFMACTSSNTATGWYTTSTSDSSNLTLNSLVDKGPFDTSAASNINGLGFIPGFDDGLYSFGSAMTQNNYYAYLLMDSTGNTVLRSIESIYVPHRHLGVMNGRIVFSGKQSGSGANYITYSKTAVTSTSFPNLTDWATCWIYPYSSSNDYTIEAYGTSSTSMVINSGGQVYTYSGAWYGHELSYFTARINTGWSDISMVTHGNTVIIWQTGTCNYRISNDVGVTWSEVRTWTDLLPYTTIPRYKVYYDTGISKFVAYLSSYACAVSSDGENWSVYDTSSVAPGTMTVARLGGLEMWPIEASYADGVKVIINGNTFKVPDLEVNWPGTHPYVRAK